MSLQIFDDWTCRASCNNFTLVTTGDSHYSQLTVAFSYRIGVSTVNYIFYETLDAIWKVLQTMNLKVPNENE